MIQTVMNKQDKLRTLTKAKLCIMDNVKPSDTYIICVVCVFRNPVSCFFCSMTTMMFVFGMENRMTNTQNY